MWQAAAPGSRLPRCTSPGHSFLLPSSPRVLPLISPPLPATPPLPPPSQVIRALHRCFLYDTGAGGAARFLDEARFQRLLPPLVQHLGMRPPASLAPTLEADGAADGAAALEASLQLGAGAEGAQEGAAGSAAAAGLDAFGRAVVACLAQLAVTAGSDAQWKPLNHQVGARRVLLAGTGRAECGMRCRGLWGPLGGACAPPPACIRFPPHPAPCLSRRPPAALALRPPASSLPPPPQVLMMTRSLEPRTRLLALETVAQVRRGLAGWGWRAAGCTSRPAGRTIGSLVCCHLGAGNPAGLALSRASRGSAMPPTPSPTLPPLTRRPLTRPASTPTHPRAHLQLAGRLSEEYLALLPETLPFLAELLEDAELAGEVRCWGGKGRGARGGGRGRGRG